MPLRPLRDKVDPGCILVSNEISTLTLIIDISWYGGFNEQCSKIGCFVQKDGYYLEYTLACLKCDM